MEIWVHEISTNRASRFSRPVLGDDLEGGCDMFCDVKDLFLKI